MIYGVTAQVVTTVDGYEKSVQVPSFMVRASSDAEAEKIARDIINPLANPNMVVLVTVVELGSVEGGNR